MELFILEWQMIWRGGCSNIRTKWSKALQKNIR